MSREDELLLKRLVNEQSPQVQPVEMVNLQTGPNQLTPVPVLTGIFKMLDVIAGQLIRFNELQEHSHEEPEDEA